METKKVQTTKKKTQCFCFSSKNMSKTKPKILKNQKKTLCFCCSLNFLYFHKVQKTKKHKDLFLLDQKKLKENQQKTSLSSKPKIICQVLFSCFLFLWFCLVPFKTVDTFFHANSCDHTANCSLETQAYCKTFSLFSQDMPRTKCCCGKWGADRCVCDKAKVPVKKSAEKM